MPSRTSDDDMMSEERDAGFTRQSKVVGALVAVALVNIAMLTFAG